MTVQRIEVDEIREDHPAFHIIESRQCLLHAIGIGLGLVIRTNPPSEEDVENLPYAVHEQFLIVELVEQHSRWRHSVVFSVRRAGEGPALTGEWTRNNSPHLKRSAQHRASCLANLVELKERDDFFVRRNLKYAV